MIPQVVISSLRKFVGLIDNASSPEALHKIRLPLLSDLSMILEILILINDKETKSTREQLRDSDMVKAQNRLYAGRGAWPIKDSSALSKDFEA